MKKYYYIITYVTSEGDRRELKKNGFKEYNELEGRYELIYIVKDKKKKEEKIELTERMELKTINGETCDESYIANLKTKTDPRD